MNVYTKLSKARNELQAIEMSKSGNNKFAGYRYFELGDFMPHINRIFSDIGLCGVVSFSPDVATLTIYDTESDGTIIITSPMAEAALKGCHPVQNLGAVETYQRRYLWVSALEIVEHDALDSSEPVKEDTTDWQAAIEGVGSVDELVSLWGTMPKSVQNKLKSKASEMKAKLGG